MLITCKTTVFLLHYLWDMTLNMTFNRYVDLKLQKYPQKWIAYNKFT